MGKNNSRLCLLAGLTVFQCSTIFAIEPSVSHPPLHLPAISSGRALLRDGAFYVDSSKGDDNGPGSLEKPWRTIQESILKLRAGQTLYLREGTYFENVICSIVGDTDRPITICGYPGEKAVLDGSLQEFQMESGTAWEPGEAPGEYVSRRKYPNLRDVLGLFADSNIGLQTYWYREDLISPSELRAGSDEDATKVFTYCGPGLYYDKKTGLIHARFAPTNNNRPPLHDYGGPVDPRKLQLAIAPFRSVPLFIDQGMHLRFRDLVIRGGGLNTVYMRFAVDIEFDHVTIFGGSYCLRSKGSGPVKLTNCGIFGQIPPWAYQSENNLQTFDPKYYSPFNADQSVKARNIARLPTHALLVTEGAEESDIFYYPFNNRWEISHCEFSDGHDGVYFNGRDMWMHHCWVDNMQDDAIYLSSPTPGICDDVHISRNYVSKCTTAFAAHGRGGPQGSIYIYGNVVDMRHLMSSYRPSKDKPEGVLLKGASLFTPHGADRFSTVENMTFAYNTVLIPSNPLAYAGRSYFLLTKDTQRISCNSIYVYLDGPVGVPDTRPPAGPIFIDGNLHWTPGIGSAEGAAWLEKIRNSVKSKDTVAQFQGVPWDGKGAFADPQFLAFDGDEDKALDLRLREGSPAGEMGLEFPTASSLRDFPAGKAVGAFQIGDPPLQVGIGGRIRAGTRKAILP